MLRNFKLPLFFILLLYLSSCAKHEQENNFTDGKVIREQVPLSVQQDLLKAVVSDDYISVNRIADTPNIDLDMILSGERNALMESVFLDNLFIAELLVSKGANPNFANEKGLTAYDYIIEENTLMLSILDGEPLSEEFLDENFIDTVKEAKAIEDKDKVLSKLRTLLLRGADINTVDKKLLSSLIYTVYHKQYDVMSFLCNYQDLDVDYIGGKGRRKFSAKKLAKRKRDKKALEILENCPTSAL